MPEVERNYYVICDDNCKFEGMTKEQILEAIAEATGETPTHIDDAFITKIKEQNQNGQLKWWVGTQAQYNAIDEKDGNTFYIIGDASDLDDLAGVMSDVEQLKVRLTEAEADIASMIESGSNYCKMSDGTMMVWGESEERTISNNQYSATLYFGREFINPPKVILQVNTDHYFGTTDKYEAFVTGVTKTSVSCRIMNRAVATVPASFSYFAIGRWKE